MNRFQRQLEVAMQAINEMQDEYSIMCHEHRDLLAKTKRLRFAQYGKHDSRFQDALVRAEERAVDNRILDKLVYFDVTTWLWNVVIDVEARAL